MGFGRSEQYKLSFFSLLMSFHLPLLTQLMGFLLLKGKTMSVFRGNISVSLLWSPYRNCLSGGQWKITVHCCLLDKPRRERYRILTRSSNQRRKEVKKVLAGAASIPGTFLLPAVEQGEGRVHRVPEAASPLASG